MLEILLHIFNKRPSGVSLLMYILYKEDNDMIERIAFNLGRNGENQILI